MIAPRPRQQIRARHRPCPGPNLCVRVRRRNRQADARGKRALRFSALRRRPAPFRLPPQWPLALLDSGRILDNRHSSTTIPRREPCIEQQTISALPPGFAGTSFASEIAVSPDGKFLYSANRLHDTIAICAIGTDGRLNLIGETPTLGDYPRHFRIDPSGNFLYVCNQKSDSITSFRRNHETGLLTFTGQYTPVGSPAILDVS